MTRSSAWKDRSVLLTGHTGFKGGWLAMWLTELGAAVHGYALEPPTDPNLFEVAGVASRLASDTRADLAELPTLMSVFARTQPHVVFHLAAQPLVLEGYRQPLGTWATNVMGTVHVLEAVRATRSVGAVVVVTTDKVYENREGSPPHHEDDRLGGQDPYSASKAAAEMVAASYRASYFSGVDRALARIATARAGNVIGGADWACDRLIPDCLRAFARGRPVQLRHPDAVRPWQHVLEPLSGYIVLAEHLLGESGNRFATSWNFGPDAEGDATVSHVATDLASLWGNGASILPTPIDGTRHERGVLRMDATRAQTELNWRPRWKLIDALQQTVAWHRAWVQGRDMTAFTLDQIRAYDSIGVR